MKLLKTAITLSAVAILTGSAAAADTPVWLEADSAAAIASRLKSDFSLTMPEAIGMIKKLHPEVSDADIREFVDRHYVETRVIDGVEYMHRKSPRNLALLNPAMNGGGKPRGAAASKARIAYVDSVIACCDGRNDLGRAHGVTYRFTIDVPYNEALKGDTLRAWMPLPLETQRQKNVRIVSSFPQTRVVSSPETSVHNTVYFEQPVTEGRPTHFECTVSFDNLGEYFSPEYIRANIKPYDKTSELYRRYTAFEAPHIIKADSLARAIVGDATDPFECSELVYDYIIARYPWAGAREYSTIECIPQYVIDEGHGDCGQVSLLYISLMRSLGHTGAVGERMDASSRREESPRLGRGLLWRRGLGACRCVVRPLYQLGRRTHREILFSRHGCPPSRLEQRRLRQVISGKKIRAQRDRRLSARRSRVDARQSFLSGLGQ